MRAALVLRPEPGNARTAERLAALGIPFKRQPLFAVTPVAWMFPAPNDFDALMLTSANGVRHAGPGLQGLGALPVVAVGRATGAAAEAVGLSVALTGEGNALDLVSAARARGFVRLLHLTGRDRVTIAGTTAITVYRSDPLPVDHDSAQGWHDHVALLHSARAARRFAELTGQDDTDRTRIAVAALSRAVLVAAGEGWAAAIAAITPTDAALVACAAALIDPFGHPADKQGQ